MSGWSTQPDVIEVRDKVVKILEDFKKGGRNWKDSWNWICMHMDFIEDEDKADRHEVDVHDNYQLDWLISDKEWLPRGVRTIKLQMANAEADIKRAKANLEYLEGKLNVKFD